MGASALEFSSSSSFSRSWRVFVSRLGLWSLFLFVMDMLGYCVRHIPSFRTLWICNICGVYLN